jgi:hypothetical protein
VSFKLKAFSRFQRKQRLTDAALCDEVARAEHGLIDADLGGGLIKQRVPRRGQGRSGGCRTLIAYRASDRSIFLVGYAKCGRESLEPDEVNDWRIIAARFLGLSEDDIEAAIEDGDLEEIDCGKT